MAAQPALFTFGHQQFKNFAMMKAFSIILVLLLAVSTAVPMLVMSHSEINAFRTWFEKLGMESQSIMYALLRIISYPYHRALQNGLLGLHGIVGTVLVVTIGEVLGSGLQLVLFECAQILLPLVGSSVVVQYVRRAHCTCLEMMQKNAIQ